MTYLICFNTYGYSLAPSKISEAPEIHKNLIDSPVILIYNSAIFLPDLVPDPFGYPWANRCRAGSDSSKGSINAVE
ncbi:hypothetical protein [Microcoleus sp.]|uniref:hypothetical protein n=1 Tax=Microcoleus sp. TaxID=44472 RepID=UPI00352596B2